MKNIYFLAIMFLLSLNSFSQELSETVVDKKLYLRMSMKSESNKYNSVYVLFKKGEAKKFLKKLKSYCKHVEKWSKKAADNNVTNYRKPITGTISFSHFQFTLDELENTSNDYFMVPSFDIDDTGTCFLLLRGYYKGYNTTKHGIPTKKGNKITYQQLCEFNYYVRVPSDNLWKWYKEVEESVNKYKSRSYKYNNLDKLFE